MKLSRKIRRVAAKMTVMALALVPNIVRAVDSGGSGGVGGSSQIKDIESVGFVQDIVRAVAPIVAFIFWLSIFVFGIVFAVKFVYAIVGYFKAPGDDMRAKDEAKDKIVQSGIALLVVAMISPMVNLILGLLGWDLIKLFFKLDLSILR